MIDRNKLKQAHESLIDSYLEQLKQTYLELSLEKRPTMLHGLEILIEHPESLYNITNRNASKFDYVQARRIRIKEGLTLAQLARNIDLPGRSATGMISCYENGRNVPGARKGGKVATKYIKWLKDHGYQH